MATQKTTWSWKVVEGDMVRSYTNSGYETVSGKDKGRQDVANVLATDTRSSTGLGCSLDECVGLDAENPVSAFALAPVAFDFQQRVQIGMNRLMAAQKTYHYAYRPNTELIYSSGPVQIWPIREDPRNFRWQLPVTTVDGRASFAIGGETRG
jgi:hypothetical protein